jgi:hypothetical protein
MSYQYPDNFKPQDVQKCNTFKPSVCSGDAYQCLDQSNVSGNVCNYYPFLCLQEKQEYDKFKKQNYNTACVKRTIHAQGSEYNKTAEARGMGAPIDWQPISNVNLKVITKNINSIVKKKN